MTVELAIETSSRLENGRTGKSAALHNFYAKWTSTEVMTFMVARCPPPRSLVLYCEAKALLTRAGYILRKRLHLPPFLTCKQHSVVNGNQAIPTQTEKTCEDRLHLEVTLRTLRRRVRVTNGLEGRREVAINYFTRAILAQHIK